jgi:hypothetical protein
LFGGCITNWLRWTPEQTVPTSMKACSTYPDYDE